MRGNQAVDCKTGDDAEGMRLAGRLAREVCDIGGRFSKKKIKKKSLLNIPNKKKNPLRTKPPKYTSH